jgi:hypothetical protein
MGKPFLMPITDPITSNQYQFDDSRKAETVKGKIWQDGGRKGTRTGYPFDKP